MLTNNGNGMLQRQWLKLLLGAFVVLAIASGIGLHYAGKIIKYKIETVLGDKGTVGEVSVGLLAVEVNDLYIKAIPGWPTQDALSARRIRVAPNWLSLLSNEIVLRKVRVDDVYLSAVRAKKGNVRLFFEYFERRAEAAQIPHIRIRNALVKSGVLEFFDAKVSGAMHKVRLEDIELKLSNLNFPDFDGVSQLDVSGILKGGRADGKFVMGGDIELATLDSEIKTHLRDVDLAALKPYLITSSDTAIKSGTLDLDMTSRVKQRHLNASGRATLHNLQLESTGGLMSLPRRMAVAAMENGNRDLQFNFTINGSLDDPRFSLSDSFALRFGIGLAQALGVTVGGVGEVLGNTATGLGNTIRGWFK